MGHVGESSAQFVYLSRRRFKLAQGDLQLSEGGVARGEGVAEQRPWEGRERQLAVSGFKG